MPAPQPAPQKLCINCDNRHGCRTPAPPCLVMERDPGEGGLSGRQLMGQRGLLARCRQCGHFRQCWTEEAFRRLIPGRKPPL